MEGDASDWLAANCERGWGWGCNNATLAISASISDYGLSSAASGCILNFGSIFSASKLGSNINGVIIAGKQLSRLKPTASWLDKLLELSS